MRELEREEERVRRKSVDRVERERVWCVRERKKERKRESVCVSDSVHVARECMCVFVSGKRDERDGERSVCNDGDSVCGTYLRVARSAGRTLAHHIPRVCRMTVMRGEQARRGKVRGEAKATRGGYDWKRRGK